MAILLPWIGYIFDKVNDICESIRRRLVDTGTVITNRAVKGVVDALYRQDVFEVESKVQELRKTEFPPLSRNSLSFFDNFRILSGIPVFVLHPLEWRDPDYAMRNMPSTSQRSNVSSPVTSDPMSIFQSQCQIICTTYSPDGNLLATGHQDGGIMLWDTEHGVHKRTITRPRSTPVAGLAFYSDSSRYLIACDFSGTMTIHDVLVSENSPVVVSCGSNWERTQMPSVEGQWPKLCPQGKLLVYPIQVVIENRPDRVRGGGEALSQRLYTSSHYDRFKVSREEFNMQSLDTINSNIQQRSETEFSHFCILYIFNTRDERIVRSSVYGDAEGKAYNWGHNIDLPSMTKLYVPVRRDSHDYALSSTEISFDSKGLLIGVNGRPQGHLIVWPDFRERPLYSYRLEGMVGRWSPCNKYIASWDIPLASSPDLDVGKCFIFSIEELLASHQKCSQNGETDHPRYFGYPMCTLKCPSENPIYWTDFVSILPGVIGVATCSVGETEVQVVLWDITTGVPVQTFQTGLSGEDIRLSRREAWAERWVSARPSWGLNFISVSPQRDRLGFFALGMNKGFIWDTEKRIQRLWISANDKDGNIDPTLIDEMDFLISPQGDKFLTVSGETLMIWCPHQLLSKEKIGTSWVSLSSSDPELGGGRLRCKFSRNGNFIGLMRLFCTVMDIWDLDNGTRYILKLKPDKKQLINDSEDEDSAINSLTGLLGSTVSSLVSTSADKTRGFCQFCISPRGFKVVTCMGDNSVLLWDLNSKEPDGVEIAKLRSRYYAAWDVCFCPGTHQEQTDLVVACEDTGHLVWIDFTSLPARIERKDGGGIKRCTFSADGRQAVLMPDDIQVRVWDLITRQQLYSCTYNIWLGKSGTIKFPHNISFDGKSSFVGLDRQGQTVLCHPETTYQDLKNCPSESRLAVIPSNVRVDESMRWVIVDRFNETVFAGSGLPTRVASQARRAGSGSISSFHGVASLKAKEPKSRVRSSEDSFPVETVLDDPLESHGLTERYPDIRDHLADEHLSDYLRERTPQNRFQNQRSDFLLIRSIDGTGTSKDLWLPGLCPEKFIVISEDGRKIACMGDGNKLQIWTANASFGCIPTSLSLLHFSASDPNYLVEQLQQFGPGVLNQQDQSGLTLALRAIYNKDVGLLKSMLGWAKETNLKLSLKDELVDLKDGETQTLNALNLALGSRSPEVTRLILKYLLDGVCTELETSQILQDSLIRLSGVYPSILLKILDSKKVMLHLQEINVPEWAFARSEYKVTASNELIPTPENLYKMWVTEGLEKQDQVIRRSEFKRTSAYACVMPYPDIAEIGMQGIIRPLLFNRVPHYVFATWPIRCVVKYKWGLYGKRLVIEDFVHYLSLLFFFTLYTLLVGFLANKHSDKDEDDEEDNDDDHHEIRSHKNGTYLILISSIALAFVSLIRKLLQLREMWNNKKWKGIFYWAYDYWNILEVLCYILIVLLVPGATIGRTYDSKLLAGSLAISCILLWAKTLYYAQAFKSTGPLVIMIREIVKDIRFYLFLLFAILMGFTIAFFVLFRNDRCKNDNEDSNTDGMDSPEINSAGRNMTAGQNEEECNDDVNKLFGTFDRTLITMFSMMLGEVSDVAALLFTVDEKLKFVGIVMFTLYMLAVTIVLLNLLIAIMGDGFDRVKATDMSYFLQKRAQIIDDMETMLTKERSEALSKKITKYLHVLLPKYKSEIQVKTGEWAGRMKDAQDRFKSEVVKMFSKFSVHLTTVTENQVLLANRIDQLMQRLGDTTPGQVETALQVPNLEVYGADERRSEADELFDQDSLPDTV